MCTCARLVAAHIKSGMCSSESTLISEANSGCVRVCQSVCRDERGEPSTNGSAVDHRFGGCNSRRGFCHKKKATSSITYHIIMTASQCGACWLNESPSAKNTPASEYIWESIRPASCVRESNTSPVGSRRTLQAALFSRAFCRVPSCFRFTRVITELDHWADRVTLQTALSLAGRWPASFTTEELSEAGKYVSYLGASSSQSSWRLL